MGESTSVVVKRAGPGFVAVYLLYKTFDMYDRAMNLDMDYMMYREECFGIGLLGFCRDLLPDYNIIIEKDNMTTFLSTHYYKN